MSVANSELREVFLSGGLHSQQQAASQEWPGSKKPSQELPSLSGAGRGRRKGEIQLLEGQELAGSLLNMELPLVCSSWLCHPRQAASSYSYQFPWCPTEYSGCSALL